MKKTLNVYDMKHAFEDMGRDYYSFDGLQALLDYYDEIDENMEFDVVAICCECTEYGEHGATCNFDDLKSDYSHILSFDEWVEDMDPDDLEEMDDDEKNDLYIDALIEKLEEETTVLHVSNGNYIIFKD